MSIRAEHCMERWEAWTTAQVEIPLKSDQSQVELSACGTWWVFLLVQEGFRKQHWKHPPGRRAPSPLIPWGNPLESVGKARLKSSSSPQRMALPWEQISFGGCHTHSLQLSQSHPWAHRSYKSSSPCAGKGGQKPELHWAQLQAQQILRDLLEKRGNGTLHHLLGQGQSSAHMDSSLGCSLQTHLSKTKVSL